MQVKNETQSGISAELKIVPEWAWVLAVIGFIAVQFLFHLVIARQADAPPHWVLSIIAVLASIVLGCYLLFIGYVNRDSKRRGMSPLLWTVVATLIPNALGIILYFILRQPLRSTCPKCGTFVFSGYNFCPQCNYKLLGPACPQCQHAVSVTDVYCPYCGISLTRTPVPSQPISS